MMTFLARMKIKPDRREDFIRLARELTEKVHANEPDTTAYEFFRLRDDEYSYAVFEQFTSEDAEEAHRNTDYFNALAPDLIDCLDGPYVREYLDPLE